MLLHKITNDNNELRDTIRKYYRAEEEQVINELLPIAQLSNNSQIKVNKKAVELAEQVRKTAQKSAWLRLY